LHYTLTISVLFAPSAYTTVTAFCYATNHPRVCGCSLQNIGQGLGCRWESFTLLKQSRDLPYVKQNFGKDRNQAKFGADVATLAPLTSAPPTVMNSQKYLLGATCDMVEIYSSLKLPYLIAMCRNKSRREQYPGSACRQSSSSIISTSDVLTNNSADL